MLIRINNSTAFRVLEVSFTVVSKFSIKIANYPNESLIAGISYKSQKIKNTITLLFINLKQVFGEINVLFIRSL